MAWRDGANHVYTSAPSASSNYALPGVLTPGGNNALATSVTYASSWAVTSVSGPNGATGTTFYDGFGRPSQTTIPDGAVNHLYVQLCRDQRGHGQPADGGGLRRHG